MNLFPAVLDGSYDDLHSGKLTVHAETEDEAEEDDRPELRAGHLGQGVREHNEHQPGSCSKNWDTIWGFQSRIVLPLVNFNFNWPFLVWNYLTICHDLRHGLPLLVGEVAEHGEHGQAAQHAHTRVRQRDQQRVADKRPAKLVVGRKGDQRPECNPDRVKNLQNIKIIFCLWYLKRPT